MRKPNARVAVVSMMVTMSIVAGLAAQSAQRLSDKDVKELLEAVDYGRDRFEDQLDGKLKRSILQGPRGEVNVDEYLDDLQENVDRLRERFNEKYAASAEATTVLRQTSDIHRFIKSQSGELKGGSEWDRLVADLTRLAQAYGTEFPMPVDGTARRINDAEASGAAANVAKLAGQLKGAINKEKTMTKPDRDAIRKELDIVKKDANVVKSRAGDGKPAAAEARQLFESATRVSSAFGGRTLTPETSELYGTLRSNLATLEQAYGLTASRGTH
jgi:hypothetical protein